LHLASEIVMLSSVWDLYDA